MSLPEHLQSKVEALSRAASAERHYGDGGCSDEFEDVVQAIRELDRSDRLQLFPLVSGLLPEIPSAPAAGAVALLLAEQVEDGMDPETSGPAVRNSFLKWCSLLPGPQGQEEYYISYDGEDVQEGLTPLGQSLTAHLARLPAALQTMRDDRPLLAELERRLLLSPGITLVLELCENGLPCPNCRKFTQPPAEHCASCEKPLQILEFAISRSSPAADGRPAVEKPGRHPLVEATGLNFTGLVAVPLLMFYCVMSGLLAFRDGQHQWLPGAVSFVCGILCLLAYRYCRKTD